MNYFEVFGLPRRLDIEPNLLEKKFHELSRKHHPDYFAAGKAEDKEQALATTALLNDAYRTLRHPVRRVEYLVNLEGFKPDGSKVPKSFLMEVFEINEQIEEIKSGSASPEQVAAVKRDVEQRAADFDSRLQLESREWDRLIAGGATAAQLHGQLAKLTEILSASSYIRNLQRDLEATA